MSMRAQGRLVARRLVARAGVRSHVHRVQEVTSRAARRDRRDGDHLRLLLAFALRADANCVDVGCYRGEVLRLMRAYAPAGRHIAYEPLPEFAAELARDFPDVDVRNVALADADGETAFTHVRSAPAYSGLRERDYPGPQVLETLSIRTARLDADLPGGYVPDLIKIDVEGAELGVLRGGLKTIATHRPIVCFEHGQGAAEHYGTRPGDVHDLLVANAGLRIFDIDGNGPYSRGEFEDVFSRDMWFFVARA